MCGAPGDACKPAGTLQNSNKPQWISLDLPITAHVQSSWTHFLTHAWNIPATFSWIHKMCVSLHCWHNLMTQCVHVCTYLLACSTVVSSLVQTLFIAALHTTLAYRSILRVPLQQLEDCVLDCVGESLCDGLVHFTALTLTVYTCTQFLCSILLFTTFTTNSELFLDQNILLIFYCQIARSLNVFIFSRVAQSGTLIADLGNLQLKKSYTWHFTIPFRYFGYSLTTVVCVLPYLISQCAFVPCTFACVCVCVLACQCTCSPSQRDYISQDVLNASVFKASCVCFMTLSAHFYNSLQLRIHACAL